MLITDGRGREKLLQTRSAIFGKESGAWNSHYRALDDETNESYTMRRLSYLKIKIL